MITLSRAFTIGVAYCAPPNADLAVGIWDQADICPLKMTQMGD